MVTYLLGWVHACNHEIFSYFTTWINATKSFFLISSHTRMLSPYFDYSYSFSIKKIFSRKKQRWSEGGFFDSSLSSNLRTTQTTQIGCPSTVSNGSSQEDVGAQPTCHLNLLVSHAPAREPSHTDLFWKQSFHRDHPSLSHHSDYLPLAESQQFSLFRFKELPMLFSSAQFFLRFCAFVRSKPFASFQLFITLWISTV